MTAYQLVLEARCRSGQLDTQLECLFDLEAVSASFKNKSTMQSFSLLAGIPCSLDLKDIKVVSKLGGTIDDSEMIDGMVFDHKAAKSAGGPTKIENAKIGLIQFQISPPKTDLENNVIISDYAQMDRILKEERNYILQMIKKIRATGCNVLLIQKSILRDAVTELSLHYLVSSAVLTLV